MAEKIKQEEKETREEKERTLTAYFTKEGVRFDVKSDATLNDLGVLAEVCRQEVSFENLIGRQLSELAGKIGELDKRLSMLEERK